MQIRAITVNAAGITGVERGIQKNRNQTQPEGSTFGPECRVTISREGKSLSRRQAAQAETGTQSAQGIREEKKLLRAQEQAELSKEIREGYREQLNEIEKQITEYNTAYTKFDRSRVAYDGALMNKTVEMQEKLKAAMQSQKQFQIEESQRRAKEAQQAAMQSAQYREEIDENNRELVTLLKTVEEAEKAEEEQENGGKKADANGSGADMDTSGAGNSVSGVIQNMASQYMTSAVNREERVQDLLGAIGDSGHWFIDTANDITQNVLRKSADIKATIDDDSFTDEQIADMMQTLQESMKLNYDNVKNFRAFGMKVLRDVREDKIQHLADDPLKNMQATKNSMMRSASDAALGEARLGSLDKASQELAEEVKDLIDERNDADKIRQDREEESKEQEKKAADEEEQA